MLPTDAKQGFSWSKASMVLVSLSLGFLLMGAMWRLGEPGAIDGLREALQIVAAPGALVLVILMPYMVVRSGGEWVEERHAKATLQAEQAALPNLSLLRASDLGQTPGELLLRPMSQSDDSDSQQLMRPAVISVGD
ncbi:MAG: hypothetical protein JWN14_4210 [Chthonomonadales bacterium]|nr:hypothetical protein [Chthonomonadales bacterium]